MFALSYYRQTYNSLEQIWCLIDTILRFWDNPVLRKSLLSSEGEHFLFRSAAGTRAKPIHYLQHRPFSHIRKTEQNRKSFIFTFSGWKVNATRTLSKTELNSFSEWWAGLDFNLLPQELWHGFSASWESSICERKLNYPGNRTQDLLLSGEI